MGISRQKVPATDHCIQRVARDHQTVHRQTEMQAKPNEIHGAAAPAGDLNPRMLQRMKCGLDLHGASSVVLWPNYPPYKSLSQPIRGLIRGNRLVIRGVISLQPPRRSVKQNTKLWMQYWGSHDAP